MGLVYPARFRERHMLRGYQGDLYTAAQQATLQVLPFPYSEDAIHFTTINRRVRSVLVQLPTGGGKTPLSAAMISSAYKKGRTVWFMFPRNELGGQASRHLTKWGVPHSMIAAGREESRAYKVHAVSKDTILRRLNRIKNWPDFLIIDECHLALDAQLLIMATADAARAALGLPPMVVIGQTATPERLDGRGLWSGVGGPYDTAVFGPSIPWLTERAFLSPLRYFAPPIEGLDKLPRRGTDVNEADLEALLEKKKIYGDVIGYYEKYGTVKHSSISNPGQPVIKLNKNYSKGRPALIFCRSVKSAYETAKRFQDAGFNFHCIEGKMSEKELNTLIEAHRDGKIDGLTNCELATYGLDIPRIEYGASIRPSESRALVFQSVGRILRPFDDEVTGYHKEEAFFFDHANLIQSHQDPRYPGVPLFKIDDLEWNFKGQTKRKRLKPSEVVLRQCPHLDYQWCDKASCAGCRFLRPGESDPRRGALAVVDTKLEERKGPTKLNDLPPEEKREVQDRIGKATDEAFDEAGAVQPGPIGELLAVAKELGRAPMWVYHWLLEQENKKRKEEGKAERLTINAPLLYEIARQAGYKTGWAYFKMQDLKKGIKEEAVV